MTLNTRLIPDEDNITAMSNARIGYEQVLANVESGDEDAEAMLTTNTFERFTSASGTVSRTFTTTQNETIDYIAIAGHNLATAGATINIQYATTIAGTDVSLAVITPTTNRPIMIMFDELTIREVTITLSNGTDREIAHIRAGKALVMQQPIYGGHRPSALNAKTRYQSNMSDTGQFLGRNITRKGSETEYSWRHLTESWYRKYFQPFVESAKLDPFFIMWRPDYHPDEVAYAHTKKDIEPSNMGNATTLLDVSVPVMIHDDL